MKQILEALWDGQIAPGQTNGVRDPEMEHLTVLMDRSRTELEGELTAALSQGWEASGILLYRNSSRRLVRLCPI